jgi:hypothetical protein
MSELESGAEEARNLAEESQLQGVQIQGLQEKQFSPGRFNGRFVVRQDDNAAIDAVLDGVEFSPAADEVRTCMNQVFYGQHAAPTLKTAPTVVNRRGYTSYGGTSAGMGGSSTSVYAQRQGELLRLQAQEAQDQDQEGQNGQEPREAREGPGQGQGQVPRTQKEIAAWRDVNKTMGNKHSRTLWGHMQRGGVLQPTPGEYNKAVEGYDNGNRLSFWEGREVVEDRLLGVDDNGVGASSAAAPGPGAGAISAAALRGRGGRETALAQASNEAGKLANDMGGYSKGFFLRTSKEQIQENERQIAEKERARRMKKQAWKHAQDVLRVRASAENY